MGYLGAIRPVKNDKHLEGNNNRQRWVPSRSPEFIDLGQDDYFCPSHVEHGDIWVSMATNI